MKLIHLATVTAAVALLGGAAMAQDPQTPPSSEATPGQSTAPAPSTDVTAPAPSTESSATTTTSETTTAPTGTGTEASVTVSTTTNGPIPDTKENRSKYGQPLSRAGKRTSAKGN